jgi:hypothetical protein
MGIPTHWTFLDWRAIRKLVAIQTNKFSKIDNGDANPREISVDSRIPDPD